MLSQSLKKFLLVLFLAFSCAAHAQDQKDSTGETIWEMMVPIMDASNLGISKIDTSTKGYETMGIASGNEVVQRGVSMRIKHVMMQTDASKPPALGYYVYLYEHINGPLRCYASTIITDDVYTFAKYTWTNSNPAVHLLLFCPKCKGESIHHYTIHPALKEGEATTITRDETTAEEKKK